MARTGAPRHALPGRGLLVHNRRQDEIVTAFHDLFNNFEVFEIELSGVYPAADSDAVGVEYIPRATLVGGSKYTNDNIAVFRFRDGLISDYHDYFDPRRFQSVVDQLR